MIAAEIRGWCLLVACLIAWPATHVLMVVTDPPENSWVFHVLLGISFLALVLTAWDIIETAKARKEQQ